MQRMTDEEAMEYYADPANQRTTGRAVRRSGKALSTHVPVRFAPDAVAAVKHLADEDHMSVSAWIRRIVAREIERRMQPTTGLAPTATTTVVRRYEPREEFRSVTGWSRGSVPA